MISLCFTSLASPPPPPCFAVLVHAPGGGHGRGRRTLPRDPVDPELRVRNVSDAHYFLVLAGPWRHDNGSIRDERGWGSRGWCRVEQLANALSPRVKPLIVASSDVAIHTYGPGGMLTRSWLYNPVGLANFTVDADRTPLGPTIASLIEARARLALTRDDLVLYRMLRACKRRLLEGLPAAAEVEVAPYHEWMQTMRFATVGDEQGASGLTPLLFAVIAGRLDLCRQLLANGSSVSTRLAASHPQYELVKGQSLLSVACAIRDEPELIELLLAHGATPSDTSTDPKLYPLHFATMHGHKGNIDALMRHQTSRCSLESQCGSCPLRGDVPFACTSHQTPSTDYTFPIPSLSID